MKKEIIVLSTGRTGTKFLSQLLSDQINDQSLHQGRYSRTLNILGNVGLCLGFEESVKWVLCRILKRTDRMGSTVDPLLSVPLTLIFSSQQKLKQHKILHIVRDPRDFTFSFMNWRRQKMRRMFLHHCVPLWQPNPWVTREASLATYLKMSKFEHFCWIWTYKNQLYEKRFRDIGTEYLRIRFEDVTGQTLSSVETRCQLADFLELSALGLAETWKRQKVVNRSTSRYFPPWIKWSIKQAKILDKHCGPLMMKYGYGQEAEWQELIGG